MGGAFPSMEGYLARLPNGLASYPHVTAKGSVLRAILSDANGALGPSMGLPARIEELIAVPPAPNGWLLEVELWALTLCIYDVRFADKGGVAAYEEWVYRRNRALLSGPLYKVLFTVLGPERLVAGAAQRYATFHRGTVMSKLEAGDRALAFKLTTPPHVLPALVQGGLAAAFRAALDLAGAHDVRVTARAESPDVVAFEASWS